MNYNHPSQLSLWRKLGYAVGGLGDSLAFNTISFYLLFYLINIAAIPPLEAGLLVGTPRALLSPLGALVGPLSDRIRTKWGRRRVFLLVCGPVMGSFFFLQFFVPSGWSLSALIGFWWIIQFGLNISMTLTLGAYQAMAAEVTSSSTDRMQLVSMQQGFGVLGGILGPSLTIVLVNSFGGAQTGFTRMGLIYGFVIALMFIIVFLSTVPERESSSQQASQSLWKDAWSILRLRSFQIQIGVAFLVQAATVIFNAIIVFYLTFVLHVEDLLPLIILVASLSSLGSIIFWNWFSRRTRRWAFITGVLLYVGTLFALSVLPVQSAWIWVLTAVIGVGSITTAIFPKAVLADVIADDQRDIGRSRAGLFTGLYGLSTRIGNAIGGTLIGWLLSLIGFSRGTTQGLRWVIGFVPSVFLLIMIPLILIFRPSARTRKDPN
ncbi:MAG: MFS transporter [Candidatus Bathyarchaeota archaeon]|jgi:GPH family glycoside/pentoside/hexuronide:cation symporter|nr:MFS transporter [Candidatus Bathyarchaeota archaeon]